jgi:hypothetical protein
MNQRRFLAGAALPLALTCPAAAQEGMDCLQLKYYWFSNTYRKTPKTAKASRCRQLTSPLPILKSPAREFVLLFGIIAEVDGCAALSSGTQLPKAAVTVLYLL